MSDKESDDFIHVGPFSRRALSTRELEFDAPLSADKSMTHRALMLAGMARGKSVITNPLDGEDCVATREALCRFGVSVESGVDPKGRVKWEINSPGLDHWVTPSSVLDLGNSGTSARLLTGLCAGGTGLRVELTGDDSLRRRPMGRVVEPLRNMGAQISGEQGGDRLKLTITSSLLTPRTHYLAVASAQIKSAIILAAISASGETIIELPAGGRDHTEIMLASLGAHIRVSRYLGRERISVTGPWRPAPFQCEIPTDPSSVAFFAALAALHPGLRVTAKRVMKNKTRTGFFDVLSRMGVQVLWADEGSDGKFLGEKAATVTFFRPQGVELRGTKIAADEISSMIDEIPVLAAVCALAQGPSEIKGLGELRVKESDRLSMIAHLLKSAGVTCVVSGDDLMIQGQDEVSAFSFGSDDHRMVMTAMILATRGRDNSKIEGLSWIRTSFPLFPDAFQNIKSMLQ